MKAKSPNGKIPANNTELASVFHQMASCYRYLGANERFRAIAYENIARRLNNMTEDIAQYAADEKTLDAVGGIGESIAGKIMEYLHTGKIKTFEELKTRVPFQLLGLMEYTGIGAATLRLLHTQLHINTPEQLIAAIEKKQTGKVKGLAQKRIGILKRALKLEKTQARMQLAEAVLIGNAILKKIEHMPGVLQAALAGSIRRKKETVGDIDIVIAAVPGYRKIIASRFITLPMVAKVLAVGLTKISVVLKKNEVQTDVRMVHDYEFGAALLYFTGSKEHNIRLRTIARAGGYKINEYGIFDIKTGKRLAGTTEEEMYAFLKLRFIPPQQRLGMGEIENAAIK